MSNVSEETPVNYTKKSTHLASEALKDLCNNNVAYFSEDTSENGVKLHETFGDIIKNINGMKELIDKIEEVVDLYDFDEKTPGNGFRSFLYIVDASISHGIQINHKVCVKRDNLLFRKSSIIKEVVNCNELLKTLGVCLQHLITLLEWCPPGELFAVGQHSPQELLSSAENINQCCFYGRALGFQFCESMRNTLKFVSLSMAIFSESYYNNGSFLSRATSSVWTSGKYVLDPETRARRIVNISQNADIEFCKAFWFLSESELMKHLPSIVATSVAVSKIISIPPEPLTVDNKDGEAIEIPIPNAHVGSKALHVRLISHEFRKGMVGDGKRSNVAEASPGLLIHCHGGGFVAQSSRSHEIYLRDWAYQLKVPILSIDYSLAPAAPFPRALEEVFYAYNWAIKNCHLLGSTGEHIAMAGDSAGANLCLGATLKCIEHGLQGPDGVFIAYAPVVVEFLPSPARLLCLMDPMLPFGFMMRCLKAYACPDPNQIKRSDSLQNGAISSDTESFEEVSESDLMELQAHKSPISETSDTLTNVSLSSQPSDVSKTDKTNTENKEEKAESQKYVSEFLEKYVLDSDTDSDGTRIPVLKTESDANTSTTESKTQTDPSFQQRLAGFMGAITAKFLSWKRNTIVSSAQLFLDSDRQKSVVEEFQFTVPRDPYLSPYWASDDILKKMPPVRVLTVNLDPCLDDCVMFAKKLKHIGNDVSLDILEGLPHGFLNLAMVSKEAHNGSKLCVERIASLLKLKPFIR